MKSWEGGFPPPDRAPRTAPSTRVAMLNEIGASGMNSAMEFDQALDFVGGIV